MDISRYCLTLGSIANFLITLLHLALVFKPQWYRYFSGGHMLLGHGERVRSEIGEFLEQHASGLRSMR